MARQVIHTDKAPGAIGPYSQAIRSGDTIYCSGQICIDPATGKLVEGDVAAQARQALVNLREVLRAAGAELSHVVKTTVLLQQMSDFAAVNAVYGEFFTESPPARATFQVAGLPLGSLIEIDAVAVL